MPLYCESFASQLSPAIRRYARCGFAVYGIEPKAIHYDGVFYDELLMAKQIG